eukprot:261883_1
MKMTNMAHSLRGSAVSLESKMNDQVTMNELIGRNILKRPSISRSLQPNAEALESELIRNLTKHNKNRSIDDMDETPLYKRDGRATGHQRKSSGFGTKRNMNPEYYKHDIAPSLQGMANVLHKKRISQTISRSLNSRPTKEELMDQRILYKDKLANKLQGNALTLEQQLKQRVPAQYLERIGVLLHNTDKMAPSIQAIASNLEYALRRRPSLFDGSNESLEKLLKIPVHHEDPNQYYTDKLHDGYKGDNDTPLSLSAFDEMYPDDVEKENFKLRKKRNTTKLESKMSRRMSVQDMEKFGILPKEYFDDPFAAVEMKLIRRKLAEEDLKRGLKNRSTRQELISRGLARPEYFDMDMKHAKNAIASHSSSTKKQVENQLNA